MRKSLAVLLAACLLLTGCNTGQTTPDPDVAEGYTPTLVAIENEHDTTWWWENYLKPVIYTMQGGLGDSALIREQIMVETAITFAALDGLADTSDYSETKVTREVLDTYLARYFPIKNGDSFHLGG